jgi:hypothetical protein
MRALAAKRQARVQVAEAARVDLVVGRLHHHHEVALEPVALEEPRQRRLPGRQLLAPEEEVTERGAGARELEHHRAAALHVRGSETDHEPVLDTSGQVALRRHRVEVAREHDAAGPEEHRVVVVLGRRGHRAAHVLECRLLATTLRRDVHKLQRARRERIHVRILRYSRA